MKRPAGMAASKRGLRFFGFLLAAAMAVSAAFSVARASGSPAAIASGKIAFVSARDGNPEIYTIHTDGTDLTRLTNDPASDEEPAWSPDGQRIAFVSGRSGTSELYVMNADGSTVVRRTFSGSFTENPSWSPDGTKIAFSTMSNGSANLWVVNADSGGPGPTLLFEALGWDAQPSWSPDGTRLALVSDWYAYDFVRDIFLINADGSGFTALTGSISDNLDYLGPSWSPDGASIAHVLSTRLGIDQYRTTLAVMNADGTGGRPLIPACSECGALITLNRFARSSWSPDGRVIAFTSGTTNALDVSWVEADGSASGVIVSNGWNPSWRPVGSGALDLSVGTDNRTRLLSTSLDSRAVFRSFDNSGASTSGGPHGPFRGWNARAVADGSDGLTRVLWSHLNGSAALWLLGPTGNLASYRYDSVAGSQAVDVAVGTDNTTQILWTHTNGRTEVTSVAVSGAQISRTTYGPFGGWLARSISSGPDGLTRILWIEAGGRVGLSLVDAGHIVATHRFAGARGWSARDIAVGSDNQTRILWANTDGRMALWSVDNSGALTNSGTIYGPPSSGQNATRISAGADGLTRVLWTSPAGNGTLWLMGLDNVRQSSFGFGPN